MQKPQNIPIQPGVYYFKDQFGRVLYIGKASNLKNRLAGYFNNQAKNPKTKRMLSEAKVVSWQITDSDIEALILESQLIKKLRPHFNIMLRDDKQYFYVEFTNEEFPKILVGHHSSVGTIGPFTDGTALKTTLKLLRKPFPYCTCKQKHNLPCLNYHIGKCLGYCCLKGKTTIQKLRLYRQNIKSIKEILSGKKIVLIKQLEKEMKQAGQVGNFEKAIDLRTKMEKLEKIFKNAKIIKDISDNETSKIKRIEGYDISNIQGKYATGAMVVFTDGEPDKNQYRKFKIRLADKADDTAMLREILSRRFNHPEWPAPNLIIIDGGRGQLNVALAIISKKIQIIALTKNNKHQGDHIYVSGKDLPIKLSALPENVRNLVLRVDVEAHRFAIAYYRKLHRAVIAREKQF